VAGVAGGLSKDGVANFWRSMASVRSLVEGNAAAFGVLKWLRSSCSISSSVKLNGCTGVCRKLSPFEE
jgi:hypothetical protein